MNPRARAPWSFAPVNPVTDLATARARAIRVQLAAEDATPVERLTLMAQVEVLDWLVAEAQR